MGGLTQEWRVIWKFSFWSIFTFKTLFSHSTARRRTAWPARFRGSKAERSRGARSVPSLSTLARTPPLPRERVWGFWCAPRRSEGPREAKFPFNSLSNTTRSKISGATGRTNLKFFPLRGVHSCLKSSIPHILKVSKIIDYEGTFVRRYEGNIVRYSLPSFVPSTIRGSLHRIRRYERR